MDRFVRQRTLAAVGDEGQQRIAAASYAARPEASTASVVEREYLQRAGAVRFSAPEASQPFSHAEAFRNLVARDFAEGAWHALEQLKRALATEPDSR